MPDSCPLHEVSAEVSWSQRFFRPSENVTGCSSVLDLTGTRTLSYPVLYAHGTQNTISYYHTICSFSEITIIIIIIIIIIVYYCHYHYHHYNYTIVMYFLCQVMGKLLEIHITVCKLKGRHDSIAVSSCYLAVGCYCCRSGTVVFAQAVQQKKSVSLKCFTKVKNFCLSPV